MKNNKNVGFELRGKIEGIKRSMNRVTYEAMAAMVVRLDEVSPVGNPALWANEKDRKQALREGYLGGQFRGNWQLGVDMMPTGWLPGNIDATGAGTVAKNIGMIPAAASRHRYYLVNNAPYARALENGHSSQVPYAFVYRIKREFNGIVRKITAEIKAEGGRVK